ncbi:MAG: hypothetical protein FWF59_10165 [Turicibacter sp.]|nr:hypothetical protein [Turicibacter sp.]
MVGKCCQEKGGHADEDDGQNDFRRFADGTQALMSAVKGTYQHDEYNQLVGCPLHEEVAGHDGQEFPNHLDAKEKKQKVAPGDGLAPKSAEAILEKSQ